MMKNLRVILIILLSCCALNSYAQDKDKLAFLSKQVIEAGSSESAYSALEELKNLYLDQHKYKEFIEYLASLVNQKKSLVAALEYYTGLSRYYQLKYLEETQEWDEYFNLGSSYREEITQSMQKAIDATEAKNIFHLLSRLLIWRFHRDQQDNLEGQALTSLMTAAKFYGASNKDPLSIKYIADQLLSYGEKQKSHQLYKLYIDRLVASDIKDEELKAIANDFYNENNLELAEVVFDIYIERLIKTEKKEKLVPVITEIANKFTVNNKVSDPLYAETIFKRLEERGGKDVFDENLMYLRALNLEKVKEYTPAMNLYLELIKTYPQNPHVDMINYKLGLITLYILRDLKSGENYFLPLAEKEEVNSYGIAGIYQLGLLSQWENNLTKALEFYQRLIIKAGENYKEMVALAKDRIKEISDNKPIEYNLKTFLDASLKTEYASFDMKNSDLRVKPYHASTGADVTFNLAVYKGESGCTHVEYQHLWSGQLGKANPGNSDDSFTTSYPEAGVKVINLVIVSPAGIVDRNIDLVDVE